jgi:hypothetical protein
MGNTEREFMQLAKLILITHLPTLTLPQALLKFDDVIQFGVLKE